MIPRTPERGMMANAAAARPALGHHVPDSAAIIPLDVPTGFFIAETGRTYHPHLVSTPSRHDLRAARWPAGITCPRCGCASVAKWGRYGTAKHQRYRCLVGCQRTFNDLTGSPMARTRLHERWGPNASCLLAGRSIRYTAGRIGVAPSTAFRWRHRLLTAWAAGETTSDRTLTGRASLLVLHLPHSCKGSRHLTRAPRVRTLPSQRRVDVTGQVPVLVGADARGRLLSHTDGTTTPISAASAADLLAPSLALPVRLSVAHPRVGYTLARTLGVRWRLRLAVHNHHPWGRGTPFVAGPSAPDAWQLAREFRRWLSRYHGVASRYLANYLALHRFLARSRDTVSRAASAQLLAAAAVTLDDGGASPSFV